MIKNLALSAVVAVVISLAIGFAFPKQVQQVVQNLGSVTGSQNLSSPVCVDGVCTIYMKQAIANTWAGGSGTTTPCSFKSPNATTTIMSFIWENRTATSTAGKLSLATTTNAYATGTTNALIRSDLAAGVFDVAGSVQKTWVFNPVRDTGVVAPNSFVVVGVQGGPGAPDLGFQYTGSCTLQLLQTNSSKVF